MKDEEPKGPSRHQGIYMGLTLLLCAAIGLIAGYMLGNAIVGFGIGAAVGGILGFIMGGLVK